MLVNNSNIKQRPKSARKTGTISRFDAHDYEKTIQNLLEKIDELESKLILVCKDKYDITSEKKYIENENENLKTELENENNKNIKLSNINKEFENTINNLKIKNKNIKDNANFQIQYMNNELKGHKSKINQLYNEIDLKNDKIKNYSVDNKLIKKTSEKYKDIANKQMNINKTQDKKIINLEKQIADYSINKKQESALLLEIELLRKDNIRLLNILNSTEEYKNFCYLGQTAPGGIRYIKPKIERKAPTYKPMSKKEERARSLKEYKKYKTNHTKKLEKEDRNWVPLEAYNYLVESKNKYNLDINNDIIENLLLILNKYWQERLDREINRYRTIYQNEIKDLKCKLQNKDRIRDTDNMNKTTTNFYATNKYTRISGNENILQKKPKGEPIYGVIEDSFHRTAASFRDRYYENEIERLKKKLNEKNDKKRTARNKTYNQGNLLMTGRILDEIQNLKKKVENSFKDYENRVKYSIDNNYYGNANEKNKIMNDSIKIFFSSIQKAIDDLETKISNWKFNIQRNIGGIDYAIKNK
jgi:hypothetical protein